MKLNYTLNVSIELLCYSRNRQLLTTKYINININKHRKERILILILKLTMKSLV